MKNIFPLLENPAFTKELKEQLSLLKNQKGKITVSQFYGSSKALFVSEIFSDNNHILILLPSIQSVHELAVELSLLGFTDFVVQIDDFSKESIQERLTVISNKDKFIAISTYEVLRIKLPSKNELSNRTTTITAGGEPSYDELVEYLNLLNYNKEKFAEDPGDYAIRGSIIDFWSFSEKMPCRVEFDGDFLESIRYFDSDSQRSLNKVESVTLAAIIDSSESNESGNIFNYLDSPLVFASQFELSHFFSPSDSEKEEESEETIEIDASIREELYSDRKKTSSIEDEKPKIENQFSLDDLFAHNCRWIIEEELEQSGNRINLQISEIQPINSNFELFFNILSEQRKKNNQIVLAVENELQVRRLIDLLSEYKEELSEMILSGNIKVAVFPIKSGFYSKPDHLFLVTDYQIFNKPYRTKLPGKSKVKKSRIKDLASIKKGDYVVHQNFGIGMYAGLENIKIGDIEQESIKILYAEGGVVYVNLNYFSLVKKFSQKDNIPPKLSSLGSGEWKKTKKKVKAQIKEAARELITLYAKRKSSEGYAFSSDSIWQKELEASFFYEDTPDQSKVTEEVKLDMEGRNPMDRLVCGDVGFGKTEIAVRAAFKSINDGKQVALLVPTTILAEQHYNTFKDRLARFPIRVAAMSRFQTKTQQNETLEKLEKGEVDILIGTHRILSKDIKFKDLGLLIIDEEHRFGVMHKEKLKSLKANVDSLTLSATPIPRTLNLSLLGARDLSIIATPPPNRQPIYTRVDIFDIKKVRDWINTEIKRNGQVYFVHDRVQSIEKITGFLQKYMPSVSFGVAHGQMKPAQLEEVIYDFLNKKYHVLVATKIIESGLDIPNVNTIIINRADRFGLAELHQLRGRVGRSDRQAYAFLLVPSLDSISKKAVKRLQAIEEYTDLGEGFNLAMRDLEIRGAGNLLGTEQSGNIDSVGFDTYMKLLDEAVEELRQDEFKDVFKDLPKQIERSEPTIDSYFEIGIPKGFMPDQADRLSFYTALFSIMRLEEVDEIKEEMEDRFGKTPPIVERVIMTAILRYHASYAMLERIVIQRNRIALILPKGEKESFYKEKFVKLLEYVNVKYSKEVKLVQTNESLKLEMTNKINSPEGILKYLIEFVGELSKIISN